MNDLKISKSGFFSSLDEFLDMPSHDSLKKKYVENEYGVKLFDKRVK